MRLFFTSSPVFCFVPTLAYTNCDCANPDCTGQSVFLSFAGFDVGIVFGAK